MQLAAFYPYRSEAARDACFAYFDAQAAVRWPIASEERTVATSYGPTCVRIGGPESAPPLVLLHGITASSLMWAPNIRELSTAFRTFAVDQVGDFGKTLCTRPIVCLDDYMAWLDELFDGLELRSGVNLAGMSFGGALAAQYALHRPERLAKLVLIAPGSTVLRTRLQFWLRVGVLAVARRKGVPSFLRWIFPDMVRKDPQWIDETIDALFLNIRSLQPRKTPFPPVLTDDQWRSLKMPVLFLVGEHEVIYSPERAVRRLRRVAPAIAAEIIPGAGHDLTFAQDATVNRKILAFL
jgi:pimeloyl-ACP methyl ester carboxylesterase